MENGPIQALVEVHEDILYQSGIYSHTQVSQWRLEQYPRCGTHSVEIIGWEKRRCQMEAPSNAGLLPTLVARGGVRVATCESVAPMSANFVPGVCGGVGMEDMGYQ